MVDPNRLRDQAVPNTPSAWTTASGEPAAAPSMSAVPPAVGGVPGTPASPQARSGWSARTTLVAAALGQVVAIVAIGLVAPAASPAFPVVWIAGEVSLGVILARLLTAGERTAYAVPVGVVLGSALVALPVALPYADAVGPAGEPGSGATAFAVWLSAVLAFGLVGGLFVELGLFAGRRVRRGRASA